MMAWQEILPRRFGLLERFNHGWPVRRRDGARRTLEIGAGFGEHIRYEDLAGQDYHALELRPDMAARIGRDFPSVHVHVGDCERRQPFASGTFDRIVAVHVLEHLRNLPAALDEAHRLLRSGGQLCAVLPCEGGWAYALARNLTTRRMFERRFRMPYDWWIHSEHVNLPTEIVAEIERRFTIRKRCFFPFGVPSVRLNLVFGLDCRKH